MRSHIQKMTRSRFVLRVDLEKFQTKKQVGDFLFDKLVDKYTHHVGVDLLGNVYYLGDDSNEQIDRITEKYLFYSPIDWGNRETYEGVCEMF